MMTDKKPSCVIFFYHLLHSRIKFKQNIGAARPNIEKWGNPQVKASFWNSALFSEICLSGRQTSGMMPGLGKKKDNHFFVS